jgi:hypothetical protein
MDLVGKFMLVKTRTKDNNFGDCLYQITGPIKEQVMMVGTPPRKVIRCEMLGGTGSAAHKGLVIWDILEDLENSLAKGETHQFVDAATATSLISSYSAKNSGRPGNIIEL